MTKRINVVLPEATVKTIDRLAAPRQRSRFIERAVQHYVVTAGAEALKERLKQAALRDADLDQDIVRDWFSVDQDQWQNLDNQEQGQTETGRKGARSTSVRSIRRSATKSRKPGPR